MKPTIGRIVHYQSNGEQDVMAVRAMEPRAAIITDVHTNSIADLCVLTSYGTFAKLGAPHSAEPRPGHWNWPPREEAPARDSHGRFQGGIHTNRGGIQTLENVLSCEEPSPGDVATVEAGQPVRYERPVSPIPADAAERLAYLSRAPRKNGYRP